MGKVLVTGVPGWLGNQLVEDLVKKNDVTCLALKGMDTSSLKKLGAKVVEGNIVTKDGVDKAVKGADIVFHMAGIIHPKNVKQFYDVNTLGTQNVIEAASKTGAKRFVYISSNSVQGLNVSRDKLMKEKDANRPYMNYGKSKLQAENIVNSYNEQGKIETVILRPCWFYGPGQPERQTRLMKMVRDGKALVFGDGQNLRSMSYVDNTIQAMKLAEKSKKAMGETYWIADKKAYSMIEIYQSIADLLNVELKTINIPGLVSDMAMIGDAVLQTLGIYQTEIHVVGEMNKSIACDISKAEKELGYKPKVDLKEGMRRSIKWCEERNLL